MFHRGAGRLGRYGEAGGFVEGADEEGGLVGGAGEAGGLVA